MVSILSALVRGNRSISPPLVLLSTGFAAACVFAVGCASSAPIHRGHQAEQRQEYDLAVVEYTKALRAHPNDADARASLERAKLRASQDHFVRARRLAATGKLEQALAEYELAAELNPSNGEIDDELRTTRNKLRTKVQVAREGKTELETLIDRTRELPPPGLDLPQGVRMPATVLFSDIVGFTSLTENADPEPLVKQLNEYLSRMTAAVFQHGGTLDKFIGDAVMAVWGNVRSHGPAEDARMAARAALRMRHELRVLNQGWHEQGIAPFAIGIGINQGMVVVGNIGSQEKADPTVIGDAVNLASRLEGLTRIYGIDIILGPTATEFVREEFYLRPVARVLVKGKKEPVEISTLVGSRNDHLDPEYLRQLENYERGFRKFRERDFAGAKLLFSRFLVAYPDDYLAKLYLERTLQYEGTPPPAEWNAVEKFTRK